MCKAKLEETLHPTFRVMDVVYERKVITVDFNQFEIKSKKVFRVCNTKTQTMVNFSNIKPIQADDQTYLNFIQKEYELIAVSQITAQKNAEKNLSKRRVA
jgi:hypothetical protein